MASLGPNVFTYFDPVMLYGEQSGTKPNLVAKILATNFGVFL